LNLNPEVVRRNFLERALAYYADFATDHTADAESMFEAATALRRVGEIGRKIGHSKSSEAGYREAINLLEELIRMRSGEKTYRVEAIKCYDTLGLTLSDQGDHASGEDSLRSGINHAETLATAFPEANHLRLLVRLYCNASLPLRRQGRVVETE